MGLLSEIFGASGGENVRALGQGFGMNEKETKSAIQGLLPALAKGVKKNTSQEGGLEGLLGALSSGKHSKYLESPDVLSDSSTHDDGNAILGHIFGSKEVSRNVAADASTRTGIDAGVLKKMLPLVATMFMGAMSKKSASSGLIEQGAGAAPPGAAGLLGSLLDQDDDGSIADDLLGFAKKLF